MTVAGQKPLNTQTPNTNAPIVAIDADVSGMLQDGSGKPVTGRLQLTGFATAAWRYMFNFLSSTLPIGYGPAKNGIGGAAIQTTSNTTAVTLNKLSGQITTVSAAWTAGTIVQFNVLNNLFVAGDTVILTAQTLNFIVAPSGSATGGFRVAIDPLINVTSPVVFSFAIFKAVSN